MSVLTVCETGNTVCDSQETDCDSQGTKCDSQGNGPSHSECGVLTVCEDELTSGDSLTVSEARA